MAALLRETELDATSLPEFRRRIAEHAPVPGEGGPRSHPGTPRFALARVAPRAFTRLDRALVARRCVRRLDEALPSRKAVARLLGLAHGITGDRERGQGPVPSAGDLQGLELYVVVLGHGWLPAGAFHYDRPGHHLSRLVAGATRARWLELVPSLAQVEGGSLLFLLVGDHARVASRYGERADRFLLLEAGHLMQNLCLLSVDLGLSTVPLGGVLETEVARLLLLPRTDVVLYAGACGTRGG